jgi:hypothetical protein
MESNNSLAEKPFPSTNLAAQSSFLDQVSQNLLAQTNDKGRGEERNPPSNGMKNLGRKAGE